MIIDKLYDCVKEKGFVCVGLDTDLSYLPDYMKQKGSIADQLFRFNQEVIEATKDIAAIYKLQIAYYESQGLAGLEAYRRTLSYLRNQSLLSIGDIKRGDISATAKKYAEAHFAGDFEADFITLNPYMGFDSIEPYFDYLETGEKGIFVLLRTSNPGAKDIEYLEYKGEPLYYTVGDKLELIGKSFEGETGYSALGMVVGGTYSQEAEEIRRRYPQTFFLIPGYGAQGGKAEDIRLYLNNFNGGIVNSSRGIIKNWTKYTDGAKKFQEYTREAVLTMRGDIIGKKRL